MSIQKDAFKELTEGYLIRIGRKFKDEDELNKTRKNVLRSGSFGRG